MKAKILTLDDIFIKKAEDLFTDREKPREAFWNVYNSMEPGDVTAIGYYGVGGIGKSTLLKKIANEIDEQKRESKGLDHIIYSFEEFTTKEAFLFRLSREMCLRVKGLSFPIFDAAIAKICSEGNRDIEKLKKETEQTLLENPVVDIALDVVGDFVPGAGTVTKAISGIVELSKKANIKWEEEKGRDASLYNLIKGSDSKTLIEEYLHVFFIYDVNKHMMNRTRPLVIFLDGYERYIDNLNDAELTTGKDNWIHADYNRLAGIPNTLWVIAGREKINWNEDILPEKNLHLMGNLGERDAVQYFEKAGITDKELCVQLYELSHGTPVYMDICVRTYNELIRKGCKPVIENFGKDTSEIAHRYLGFMDKPTRRMMELIAWLPNAWTVKMVERVADKLVGYNSYIPELSVILKLSLVEAEGIRYKLHETCRQAAREVCDNTEKIQNAILEYIRKELFDKESEEDAWSMLCWLFEILELTTHVVFSEEEASKFIDRLTELRPYEGDLYRRASLSKKIHECISKKEYSPVLVVRCANVRIEDLYALGQYSVAEKLASSNYRYAVEYLSEESQERLKAMALYADSYYYKGYYKRWKDLYERCYKRRKMMLGEEHPDTLASLNSLAIAYGLIGEYVKARELAEHCYEIRKSVLGEEHPDTLVSLNTLAIGYDNLKDYIKAKELREQCYEVRKQILGEEHPDTLVSLNSLAVSYSRLKADTKAKELHERCYEIRKRVLGEEHPSTLVSLSNLALVHDRLEADTKAKELHEQCYEIRKRVLGEEHPDTFRSLKNLAIAYGMLGEYVQARELRERCYEIRKRVLEEEHPDVFDKLRFGKYIHYYKFMQDEKGNYSEGKTWNMIDELIDALRKCASYFWTGVGRDVKGKDSFITEQEEQFIKSYLYCVLRWGYSGIGDWGSGSGKGTFEDVLDKAKSIVSNSNYKEEDLLYDEKYDTTDDPFYTFNELYEKVMNESVHSSAKEESLIKMRDKYAAQIEPIEQYWAEYEKELIDAYGGEMTLDEIDALHEAERFAFAEDDEYIRVERDLYEYEQKEIERFANKEIFAEQYLLFRERYFQMDVFILNRMYDIMDGMVDVYLYKNNL